MSHTSTDPTKSLPSEPAMIRAAVFAVLAIAASFGLILTGYQREAIVTVALILVPLIQGLWTRRAVFAPATVSRLLTLPVPPAAPVTSATPVPTTPVAPSATSSSSTVSPAEILANLAATTPAPPAAPPATAAATPAVPPPAAPPAA